MKKITLLLSFGLALSCATTPAREKKSRLFSGQPQTPLTLAAYEGDAEKVKILLSQGANPSERTKHGETPLMAASEVGSTEISKLLLAAGAEVNGKNGVGWTALRIAAERSHHDVAKILIDAGANVDSPVFIAVLLGDTQMASNALALGANVDGQDLVIFKETPLMRAASNGHIEMVELLLRNKASINAKDANGETALMHTRNREVAHRLIQAGANVNARSKGGDTALMLISYQDYPELLQLLIESGANVNLKDASGRTAFLKAAWRGRIKNLQILVAAKADINAVMADGRNALLMAGDGIGMGPGIDRKEVIKMLKATGVGSPKGVNGELLKAAYAGNISAVRNALNSHANVNAKNFEGRTALMEALENDHTDVIALLIEANADLNVKDRDGSTGLMIACYRHVAVVRQLLSAGADFTIEDKFHNTALSIASGKYGNQEIAALLRVAGATK